MKIHTFFIVGSNLFAQEHLALLLLHLTAVAEQLF